MLLRARWVGRAIGLDVDRGFCVIAICEDGVVRSAGRVPSTPEGLGVLAESLLAIDRVGCRAERRALTCLGSRAASGWPVWSCP